ncbi:MAG: dihydrofolate reductase [Verrucomicrobiota bacterium]|nr:dihydrofolate reductase [Verrucomicrobiota bacterium]
MIRAIVAHGANLEIGRNNQLLCHLPGDLKRFKDLTMGHDVIMGRKTWDSLKKKPLPGRRNIVVTAEFKQRVSWQMAYMVLNLEQTKQYIEEHISKPLDIIGGAQIYAALFDYVEEIHASVIPRTFKDADAFFPKYDHSFKLIKDSPMDGYAYQIFRRNA